MMTRARLGLLMLGLAGCCLLTGCLFSINHPVMGPGGFAAVFLGEGGTYSLLLGAGTLHLIQDGETIPLPMTTTEATVAVLDWHPDGSEFLYVQNELGEWLTPSTSILFRIAADPAASPQPLHASEGLIRDAAYQADGRIVLLELADESAGELLLLDPKSGGIERIAKSVLGFRQDNDRERLYVLTVDERSNIPVANLVTWEIGVGGTDPFVSFLLSGTMLDSFLALDDAFFWDIDPKSGSVALAVYESAVLEPVPEEEVPSVLFLRRAEQVERIANAGYMPVFSPNGRYLAYIASEDGETGQVLLYETWSGETRTVPGTLNPTSCFWMEDNLLGFTQELDDDNYRLSTIDLTAGEITVIVE